MQVELSRKDISALLAVLDQTPFKGLKAIAFASELTPVIEILSKALEEEEDLPKGKKEGAV